MTKSVNKRLVIVLAALVIVCGGLAALNGTFASRVSYDDAKIELTGESFHMDLEYWNGSEYVSLLSEDAQPFPTNSWWCPGRSEIVYLKLTSAEQFPVDCTLSLKVNNSGFDDVLSYAVLSEDLLSGQTAHPASWTEFVAKAPNGAKVLTVDSHELMEAKGLMVGETKYLALCIHMSENATSEYQNKQLNMQFALRTNANHKPGDTPGN